MTILNYEITGPTDGEPLILLHAIGTDQSLWNKQRAEWERTYRVIRCDLPGHGEATVLDQSFTMFTLAASVNALIDDLTLGSAHIIGSSFGGMIGMALAIDHPECVKSLTAADVRVDAPEAYRQMWDDLISMAQDKGMVAVGDFMLTRWFGDAPETRGLDISTVSDALKSTPVAGFVMAAQAIQKMDFAARLNEITCPTLLLVGENDGVLPELMAGMAETIEHAQFVEIRNAGHLPNIDQPDVFTSVVSQFLTGVR